MVLFKTLFIVNSAATPPPACCPRAPAGLRCAALGACFSDYTAVLVSLVAIIATPRSPPPHPIIAAVYRRRRPLGAVAVSVSYKLDMAVRMHGVGASTACA
ncbi:hypothetical protein ACP70R_031775 [Stipagrostis hirtigluma subsp. patula]